MTKKPTPAADLTPAAVIERARSLANQWMWAVSLQHDRITKPRSQDTSLNPAGFGFNEADVHFLAIALRRLRAAASTIEHAPEHWAAVESAIASFNSTLPWLDLLRNVFEHLEDYAVDSTRRHQPTTRRELQVWSTMHGGMSWLGVEINWNQAHGAARELYAAVNKAASDSARSATPQ